MSRSISDLTAPDVAEMISHRGVVVMPFGSIEQHGPHLPCGTDTMAADLITAALAERLEALITPAGPYGVTPIHAGHAGTISLSRGVFEAYVSNVCDELVGQGARVFVFVNWHEGNIASLDAVATDIQNRHGVVVIAAQACYAAQRIYADKGGELTHGGGIETLAVLAHDASLARLDRVAEPTRPAGADELDAMRRSREVYGYITDVTELADDGWYGNPGWASQDEAGTFADLVAQEIETAVESILSIRRRAT
jgi:creatinine amidohydrolase